MNFGLVCFLMVLRILVRFISCIARCVLVGCVWGFPCLSVLVFGFDFALFLVYLIVIWF